MPDVQLNTLGSDIVTALTAEGRAVSTTQELADLLAHVANTDLHELTPAELSTLISSASAAELTSIQSALGVSESADVDAVNTTDFITALDNALA